MFGRESLVVNGRNQLIAHGMQALVVEAASLLSAATINDQNTLKSQTNERNIHELCVTSMHSSAWRVNGKLAALNSVHAGGWIINVDLPRGVKTTAENLGYSRLIAYFVSFSQAAACERSGKDIRRCDF